MSTEPKILNNFLEFCGTTACEKKTRNIERQLLQIQDVTEVDFDKITEKEVISFLKILKLSDKLESTKNDLKKTLKRFLVRQDIKWYLILKTIPGIKTKKATNKKITKEHLLKKGDLDILMKSIDSLKWKAFLILNWESGARPEELRLLKWKGLDFERKEVKLHSNKTGRTRYNLFHQSLIHLKRWRQEYPSENVSGEDFVFPGNKGKYKPITGSSLTEYFKRWGMKYLGRHLYPYIIRHTRLNSVRQKLSPEAYVKFAGHSMEVALETYGHLDNDDVNKEMMTRVYNVEELSEKENTKIKELEIEIGQMKVAHQNELAIFKENLSKVVSGLAILQNQMPRVIINQEI